MIRPDPIPSPPHIPWYRDQKVLSRVLQIVVASAVAFALILFGYTAANNMAARGVHTSLWFLNTEASFKVGFSPFWDFILGTSVYWEVFVIGIQNTILVSVLGIVGATILGFVIGLLRLSDNWFSKKFASAYIELFRNIPLLLQVFFWHFIVILAILPHRRDGFVFADSIYINKDGFNFPKPSFESGVGIAIVIGAVLLAFVLISALRRWNRKRQHEEGKRFPVFLTSIAIIVILAILTIVAATDHISFEYPRVTRLRIRDGIWIPVPLFSLWVALTTYTAAFIAENVRGGILAVNQGQTEAAGALGLRKMQIYRLITVPQAMRVVIPPTISQYLNLTKNSSLAIAIGYDELVNIWMGISLNQTGQALVIIAMTMAVYTVLSLLTSATLNAFNARMQLHER